MDDDLYSKLKKGDIYPFLDEHYAKIGRTHPPNFRSYSIAELKKCLQLFGIHLTREKSNDIVLIQLIQAIPKGVGV